MKTIEWISLVVWFGGYCLFVGPMLVLGLPEETVRRKKVRLVFVIALESIFWPLILLANFAGYDGTWHRPWWTGKNGDKP